MKRVSITETKNRLSALLDEVKACETIVILDRGVPIAKIEGVTNLEDDEGRLARLIRTGVVRPSRGGSLDRILNQPPVKLKSGVSVLEALLEERREGR
jgi:antitoxin (DNA-binding transcriptional repressor) of toxin-antitoxin stability system